MTDLREQPANLSGAQLTRRETQILKLLADGLTVDEIAARLFISYGTAKGLKAAMFVKLGAETSAHAVAIGFRRGLLGNGIAEDLEVVRLARQNGFRLALVRWDAA